MANKSEQEITKTPAIIIKESKTPFRAIKEYLLANIGNKAKLEFNDDCEGSEYVTLAYPRIGKGGLIETHSKQLNLGGVEIANLDALVERTIYN